jgi:hypothetical protein
MTKLRLIASTGAVVMALALGACADTDDPDGTTDPGVTTVPSGDTTVPAPTTTGG